MSKNNTPQIRFKGFTDAWEQRKLGEVFENLQNNTLSRAELSTEQGRAKNIHYGDILVKFGEVLDVDEEQLTMIADDTISVKYKTSFLQNGDVIVADTAEDKTVGKCTEISGLQDEIVISGLHTIPYRSLLKFASGYLGYYMNSAAYHNQLLPLMQGIKVTSISKSAMQNTNIVYPKSEEEQAAIGSYFKHLDHLITLHQRKLKMLKNVKKSCLEKMFPKDNASTPEVRFANFTDAWEQRKLEDIVTFFSGLTYSPNDVRTEGILVLRSSNVKNGEIVDADNVYVDPSVVNSENVQEGDIVVVVRNGSRALIGKHAEIKDFRPNTVIGAFMTGLRSEHSSFINALLNSPLFDKEIEMNMGATINQITGYMFSKMEFLIPTPEEQDTIGNFFLQLDHLITLHQRKLEKLQNIKKSCLEKMFV